MKKKIIDIVKIIVLGSLIYGGSLVLDKTINFETALIALLSLTCAGVLLRK